MSKSKSVYRPEEGDIWFDEIDLPPAPEREKIELKPITNKKLSDLIEKLMTSSDPEERTKLREKFRKIL